MKFDKRKKPDKMKEISRLQAKIDYLNKKIESYKTREVKDLFSGISMVCKDITIDDLAKNFDIDNLWYVKETKKRIVEIEKELLELKSCQKSQEML